MTGILYRVKSVNTTNFNGNVKIRLGYNYGKNEAKKVQRPLNCTLAGKYFIFTEHWNI